MVTWFSGLFYLPRLYVNLALAKEDVEYQRLMLMAKKLYRFTTPLAILTLVFGLWLWLGFSVSGKWIHVKLLLVAILIGYHGYCGKLYQDFALHRNKRSHIWLRLFNEIPAFILLAVVILAVVKPF